MVNKFIDSLGDGRSIKNEKELDDYIKDYYGWRREGLLIEEILNEEGDCLIKRYNKIKQVIENNYIVKFCEVDYYDEAKKYFMSSLPKEDEGDGIFLIESD